MLKCFLGGDKMDLLSQKITKDFSYDLRKIEEGEQFEWVEKKGWKKHVPAKEFYCKKDLQIRFLQTCTAKSKL